MTIRPARVQDHRCPSCGAPRRRACTTSGGFPRPFSHLARRARFRDAHREPRRYVLTRPDPQFGLAAGVVLVCEPYWLDPVVKVTVLYRESDRWNPGCNLYRDQVTEIRGPAGAVRERQVAA